MNKKIFGILVMTLLTISIFTSVVIGDDTDLNLLGFSNNYIDVKDQENKADFMPYKYILKNEEDFAQGFIPTKTPLSKVTLEIATWGVPPENVDFKLSIRENLYGDDILSKTVTLISSNPDEVDFVFPDTDLTIGVMYYIVCDYDPGYTEYNMNNLYNDWMLIVNTGNTYKNGEAWIYNKAQGKWNEWEPEGVYTDLVFTTYWRDYAPDIPEIDGPIKGKASKYKYIDYTLYTNDPEEHDVRYYIDWGDGNYHKWYDMHESGEYAVKSHKWESEGNYTIRAKAKDSYGAESNWTELEVSMPKTKELFNPFLRFLENHPYLFPLLRQILNP
jgi:hypothetical protein